MRRVLYNEIDPNAAEWVRQLIANGSLPDGDVDERSIADLQPADLDGYSHVHFFAGIGGWALGTLLARWPLDRPLWTGSCPCQPFSVAGRRGGTDDERHLWPHYFRLIRACRPPVVVGEQVAGKAGYDWFDGVRSDLAGEDYASRAVDIPACAVDAPHIRQRIYWIAVANSAAGGWRGGAEAIGSQARAVAGPPGGSHADHVADAQGARGGAGLRQAHALDDGHGPASGGGRGGSFGLADAAGGQLPEPQRGSEGGDGAGSAREVLGAARGRAVADADSQPDEQHFPGGLLAAEGAGSGRRDHGAAHRRRDDGGSSGMADAHGSGQGLVEAARLHDRRQSGHDADRRGGSGDVVDASGLGRGEGRAGHAVRSGRDAAASAGGGDVAHTPGRGGQQGQPKPLCGGGASSGLALGAGGGDGEGHLGHADVAGSPLGRGERGDLPEEREAPERAGLDGFGDVADAHRDGSQGAEPAGTEPYGRRPADARRPNGTHWSGAVWLVGADGKARRAEPGIRLLVDGLPGRVGLLRGYGNAIVPQQAAQVLGALMDVLP